jgi:hypothetical protein
MTTYSDWKFTESWTVANPLALPEVAEDETFADWTERKNSMSAAAIEEEYDRLLEAHQHALREMLRLRGTEHFAEAMTAERNTRVSLSNFEARHFAPAASTAQAIVNRYQTTDRSEWQRRMAY